MPTLHKSQGLSLGIFILGVMLCFLFAPAEGHAQTAYSDYLTLQSISSDSQLPCSGASCPPLILFGCPVGKTCQQQTYGNMNLNLQASCNAAGTQVTLSWDRKKVGGTPTNENYYPIRLDNKTTPWGGYARTEQYDAWDDSPAVTAVATCSDPNTPCASTRGSKTYTVQPGHAYEAWIHLRPFFYLFGNPTDPIAYGWSTANNVTFTCNPPATPPTAQMRSRVVGGSWSSYATNATVNYTAGQNIEIGWTSTNATACTVSDGSGYNFSTGNLTASDDDTITEPSAGNSRLFGITCTGPGGSVTVQHTISMAAAPPPPTYTASANISWRKNGGAWTSSNGTVTGTDIMEVDWSSSCSTNGASVSCVCSVLSGSAAGFASSPKPDTTITESSISTSGTVFQVRCAHPTDATVRSDPAVTVTRTTTPPPPSGSVLLEVNPNSTTCTSGGWTSSSPVNDPSSSFGVRATPSTGAPSSCTFSGATFNGATTNSTYRCGYMNEPLAGAYIDIVATCDAGTSNTIRVYGPPAPTGTGNLYCTDPITVTDLGYQSYSFSGIAKSTVTFGSAENLDTIFRLNNITNGASYNSPNGGDTSTWGDRILTGAIPSPAGMVINSTNPTTLLPGTYRGWLELDHYSEHPETQSDNVCPYTEFVVVDTGAADLAAYDRYVWGASSAPYQMLGFTAGGSVYPYSAANWTAYGNGQRDISTGLNTALTQLRFYAELANVAAPFDTGEAYRYAVEVDFNYNGTFAADERIVSDPLSVIYTSAFVLWNETGTVSGSGTGVTRELGYPIGNFPLGEHRWRMIVNYGSSLVEVTTENNVAEGDFQITDPAGIPACSDGADNDGDGFTDHPGDAGCSAPDDPDEAGSGPPTPECSDGIDNDGDGFTDYDGLGDSALQDPTCWSDPNVPAELPFDYPPLSVTVEACDVGDVGGPSCTSGTKVITENESVEVSWDAGEPTAVCTEVSPSGFGVSGDQGSSVQDGAVLGIGTHVFMVSCDAGGGPETAAATVRVDALVPPGSTCPVDIAASLPRVVNAGEAVTVSFNEGAIPAIDTAVCGCTMNVNGIAQQGVDFAAGTHTLGALFSDVVVELSCQDGGGFVNQDIETVRVRNAFQEL